MKLYAKTTSERATKGQGGNKYLKIEIQDENKEVFLSLMINNFPDGINCSYAIDEYKAYLEKDIQETLKITTKGKSQKGENRCNDITCINCDNTMEGLCDDCKHK